MRWQVETHAEAAAAKRYESLITDELLLAELYTRGETPDTWWA